MAITDVKTHLTRRDLVIFGLLFLASMGLLGAMALAKPAALLGAAAFTGVAFLISFIFNRELPRSTQLLGLMIPTGLLLIGGLERVGVPPLILAGVVWAAGVIGLIISLASARGGKFLYTVWMYAALPIGWTISSAILCLIFFLVIGPIGLLMRACGRDPMNRRFDRKAPSYWMARPASEKADRYFQQF